MKVRIAHRERDSIYEEPKYSFPEETNGLIVYGFLDKVIVKQYDTGKFLVLNWDEILAEKLQPISDVRRR